MSNAPITLAMRHFMFPVVLGGILGLVAVGVDAPRKSSRTPERSEGPVANENKPECVQVRAEVRQGSIGYDHVVHLNNGCEQTYECTVKTDANPEPMTVAVPPHLEVEVVTTRGSASRTFAPVVDCNPKEPDAGS